MPEQPTITSTHNPLFQRCLKLRDNRKRRRSGQFLIDGEVEIVRAAMAGFAIDVLLVDSRSERAAPLQEVLHQHPRISIQPVASSLLARLRYGQVDSGPIAVATQPALSLESLRSKQRLDSQSLVLVLDRIEKPGNLGACLRTAVACGVSAILLTRPVCDPFNPNAIRASRGAIFQMPIAETSPERVIELAQEYTLPIFTAWVEAERTLWQLPLTQGAVIVFGNETQGLDDHWLSESVQRFTIPMQGGVDSLNLSISAALTLYEAVRQKATIR